jgi:hypothetical protein
MLLEPAVYPRKVCDEGRRCKTRASVRGVNALRTGGHE